MSHPVISSEEAALGELGTPPSRLRRLERDLSAPFDRLSGDEPEDFCYLLLRTEHPDEEVVHHGRASDFGLDIVRRRRDGSVELVQCKRYGRNVGLPELRAELAKLFTNLFRRDIPALPSRIWFYVVPDLTSPARQILTRDTWVATAAEALEEHLGTEPPPDLLKFACTWWPVEGIHAEPGINLTERAERHPELLEKFFKTQKVIDGSVVEVQAGVETTLRKVLAERDIPPPGNRISGRTWDDPFDAVGRQEAPSRYLRNWAGITPEERFEAPREFPKIQESVRKRPLTILIGPPAAGKTFSALQVLWAAFQQGRQVRWIAPTLFAPTEGPIPTEHSYPDMRDRVESLTTALGIRRFHPPLDSHEFIVANLKPESTVYIEDPFGKTDEEFEYSLHTYRFFDLDECVAAISDGAARAGCHILLSSREGLFDRWLAERARRELPPIPAEVIRLSEESYDYEQLEKLSVRLAQALGFEHPDEVAFEIYYRVDFPYEIESILRALPRSAGGEEAAAEAARYRDGLKSALRRILVADSDQETLFLVILASRCTDPKTRYLRLHQVLGLSGEPESSLERVIERYRAFVVRSPAHRLMGYGPEADEVFSPSHSVVDEAISEYLRASAGAMPFLERLACALPEDGLEKKSARGDTDIALRLVSLGIGCQPQAQDAILTVLLDRGGLSFSHVRDLLRLWASLSPTFKDLLFAHLESGLRKKLCKPSRSLQDLDGNTRALLLEMTSSLTAVEVPAEDAWRFTRLLFHKEVFPTSDHYGMYAWDSPWRYLFDHLEEAPEDLLRRLDGIAKRKPEVFVYLMGEAAVPNWTKLPAACKAAFFAPSTMQIVKVQEKALEGIANHWESAASELRELFIAQAASPDPKIRTAAATAAMIYRGRDAVLDNILVASARDVDVRIPQSMLRLLGDDEEDRRFADAYFERTNPDLAAEMLQELVGARHSARGEMPQWKVDLARKCLVKGGDRAESILALLHFQEEEAITEPLHEWRASIAEEPDSIRLGALWAYGSSGGRSPGLTPEEVLSLAMGLSMPLRGLALAYLSACMKVLPIPLQDLLRPLETAADEDGDAIRAGKEKRGSDEGRSPWSFLPVTGA